MSTESRAMWEDYEDQGTNVFDCELATLSQGYLHKYFNANTRISILEYTSSSHSFNSLHIQIQILKHYLDALAHAYVHIICMHICKMVR